MSTSLARIYSGLYTSGNVLSANALSPNSLSNISIDSLKDVDVTTILPALNNTLLWNGTNWVPGSVTVSSSENANIANIVLGQVNAATRAEFANTAGFANTSNIANLVLSFGTLTTSNLSEGTNLYYTNARVAANIAATSINALHDVNIFGAPSYGQVLFWNGISWEANAVTATSATFATTAGQANVALVTNFANIAGAANTALFSNSALIADTSNATNFANVANVANLVLSLEGLTTSNLSEGSNLYFTNARVDARLSTSNINVFLDVNTTGVNSGDYLRWNGLFWYPATLTAPAANSAIIADFANLVAFANVANVANLVLSLSNFTTANLAEGGSNLYYSNARVDARIATSNLTDLLDVNIFSPSNGQILYYNGYEWIANTIAGATGGFSDVSNTALRAGLANVAIIANLAVIANVANVSFVSDFANVANVANLVLSLDGLTTSNLSEGSNLYFSNARVDERLATTSVNVLIDVDTSNATIGQALVWDGNNWVSQSVTTILTIPFIAAVPLSNVSNTTAFLSNHSTSNLIEGTNLYYTNARVAANIAATSINALADVNTTGLSFGTVLQWDGSNWSPNSVVSLVGNSAIAFSNVANLATYVSTFINRNTDDLAEGTSNLYFTDFRVDSRVANTSIGSLFDVNIGTPALNQTLVFDGIEFVNATLSPEAANFANTSNVANLVLSFDGLTTSNLTEGSNLYYTNARVRSTLTGANGISYDKTTGFIEANVKSINGQIGDILLYTSNIIENGNTNTGNVYFTNSRARIAISGGNGIEYDANTGIISLSNTTVFSQLSAVDTFANSVTIFGNLTVYGNITQLTSNVITVNDPMIQLANGNPADHFDIGILGHYTESSILKFTGVVRDASSEGKRWKFFDSYEINPTLATVIDTSNTTFKLANVEASRFYGNLDYAYVVSAGDNITIAPNGRISADVTSVSLNTNQVPEGSNAQPLALGNFETSYFDTSNTLIGDGATALQFTRFDDDVNGNVEIISYESKFGSNSLYVQDAQGNIGLFSNVLNNRTGITVEFWANIDGSTSQLLSFSNEAKSNTRAFVYAAGSILSYVNGHSESNSNPYIVAGQYNHFAYTMDNNGSRLWINGLSHNYQANGTIFTDLNSVVLGYQDMDSSRGGSVAGATAAKIDALVVYDSAKYSTSCTLISVSTSAPSFSPDNLYFTNARVDARIATTSINALYDVTISNVQYGQALLWNGQEWEANSITAAGSLVSENANVANIVLSLSNFTTANLDEGGGRFYATNTNIRQAFIAGDGIKISPFGVISGVYTTTRRFVFIANEDQETFTGTDRDGQILTIGDPSNVIVFLNGVMLEPTSDYTAVFDTISIVPGVTANSIITIMDASLLSPTVATGGLAFISESSTFNGGNASYTINTSVSEAKRIIVTVDGLVQIPTVDYNVAGAVVNFASAPPADSKVEVKVFAGDALSGNTESVTSIRKIIYGQQLMFGR